MTNLRLFLLFNTIDRDIIDYRYCFFVYYFNYFDFVVYFDRKENENDSILNIKKITCLRCNRIISVSAIHKSKSVFLFFHFC